jgi:hypothetical protein
MDDFARVQTVCERPIETGTKLTGEYAEKENDGAVPSAALCGCSYVV